MAESLETIFEQLAEVMKVPAYFKNSYEEDLLNEECRYCADILIIDSVELRMICRGVTMRIEENVIAFNVEELEASFVDEHAMMEENPTREKLLDIATYIIPRIALRRLLFACDDGEKVSRLADEGHGRLAEWYNSIVDALALPTKEYIEKESDINLCHVVQCVEDEEFCLMKVHARRCFFEMQTLSHS